MFSDQIDRVRLRLAAAAADGPPVAAPEEGAPGDPALAGLLWAPGFGRGGDFDAGLLRSAAEAKRARFGGEVYPIAPLYVTSVCGESCLYCNFRGGNKGVGVDRVRLTDEEVVAEAAFLIEDKGLRAVELVYASDPTMGASVMGRHARLVRARLDRQGGGIVGLNAASMTADEYRLLRDAGVDFVALWQETYNPECYALVHPGRTRKADFAFRLDAPERVLEAGIPHVGMGVLSGLADWRMDWATLIRHEAHLKERHGDGAAILGLPRLKPAPGAPLRATPLTPSDDELLALVALHNRWSPSTLPFVSTRERWDLCTRLAEGGGCLITLNCSTTPGGYTAVNGAAQFPAGSYDAAEHADKLRALGLPPRFDWSLPSRPAAPAAAA